jgi:excisionase family DNA binding protein
MHLSEHDAGDRSWRRLLASVEDVGGMLSCSIRHVYELVYRGEIDSVKIGRSRRIVIQSVHDYIARQLSLTRKAS